MKTSFDVLIVGGGSAGAVLANRLSTDPARRVLLLEAGKTYRPNFFPTVLSNGDHVGGDEAHDWGYRGTTGHGSRSIAALRAKTLGGCSAVNAAVAIRARPADFAKWTALGMEGWNFAQVLPAFKAIENTPDGEEHYRGRSGPLPIRQRRPDELTPALNAFVTACTHQGFALVDDFNGAKQSGVSPYPLNAISGRRINAGMAFLNDGVQMRPNLIIVPHVEIDRVLLKGNQAVGVLDVDGNEYRAKSVILSAGAFGSPAILMRSGIGPAAHLKELGIHLVADLPVGEGLQDHPFYYNVYALQPEANGMYPAAGAILWTASSEATTGDLDLHVSATHLFDPRQSATGGAIVFAIALTQPDSRGHVRLESSNPRVPPLIDYNLLGTPRDLRRMIEGVHMSRRIGRDAAFAAVAASEIFPGDNVVGDVDLHTAILSQLDVYHHPTSTVAMGRPGEGVVDNHGRVYGVDGLSVIDASIMPMVPSAPTNITTMMLAEHIAAGHLC